MGPILSFKVTDLIFIKLGGGLCVFIRQSVLNIVQLGSDLDIDHLYMYLDTIFFKFSDWYFLKLKMIGVG